MLDLHTSEHGYAEVNPPLLVRDDTMFGTAQLPKFRDDQFSTSKLAEIQAVLADVARQLAEQPKAKQIEHYKFDA